MFVELSTAVSTISKGLHWKWLSCDGKKNAARLFFQFIATRDDYLIYEDEHYLIVAKIILVQTIYMIKTIYLKWNQIILIDCSWKIFVISLMNFNYNSSIIVESIVLVKQNRKVTDEKKKETRLKQITSTLKSNRLHSVKFGER